MYTIGLFAQKGGSGKSTLSVHGAVVAAERYKVLLADTDEQGSSTDWGRARKFSTPTVETSSPSTIAQSLTNAAARGFELAFVDCPPHALASATTIARQLDFAVVPAKASFFDVKAMRRTVAVLEGAGVPFVLVLNEADSREKKINRDALEALATYGPVCPVAFPRLSDYKAALTSGRAITEYRPNSTASDACRAVWKWVFDYATQLATEKVKA